MSSALYAVERYRWTLSDNAQLTTDKAQFSGYSRSMRLIIILILLGCSPALAGQDIFHTSGLPIPRYVSLRSDEVNVRVGPGTRFPINWVYRRRGLPVKVIEEFSHWRKIVDFEGSQGWVHKSLLSGKRTAMVLERERMLYRLPDASTPPVMQAQPGVIAAISHCEGDWCQLEMQEYSGWIRKGYIWGE